MPVYTAAESGRTASRAAIETEEKRMQKDIYIEIDFNSDEALYLQVCHQIIRGIASTQLREGDSLPSVRQMADDIGINMHTVNKAYTVLRQEGYVKVDRRKGAVVCVDTDQRRALEELRRELLVVLAKGSSRGITKSQVIGMIEEIYEEYDDTRDPRS